MRIFFWFLKQAAAMIAEKRKRKEMKMEKVYIFHQLKPLSGEALEIAGGETWRNIPAAELDAKIQALTAEGCVINRDYEIIAGKPISLTVKVKVR